MVYNMNAAAHAFIPLSSSSPSAFPNQSWNGRPDTSCPSCIEYSFALARLQSHVAMLDLKRLNAEKEKVDAQSQARHLLGLYEAVLGQAKAMDLANRDDVELRRSLFLANTETECMKIMLERAWKKIADLSLSDASNSGSKPPLVNDSVQDTEDLLIDLQGPSELPKSAQGLNDLSTLAILDEQVGEIKPKTNSTNDRKMDGSAQHNETLDSDTVSNTSYVFRFLRDRDISTYSGDEEKSFMKGEKVPKHNGPQAVNCEHCCTRVNESGSESVTVVDSATSSPTSQDARLIEPPSKLSTSRNLPLISAPVPTCEIPTLNGISIHAPGNDESESEESAVEFKDQHTSVKDADPHKKLGESKRYLKGRADPEVKRFPDFLKCGLQFKPPPGSWNVFRTLVISNLPQSATMTELLDKMRGGVVVDAKLLDTSSITGGQTALVTFLHEQAAKEFQTYAKEYSIAIGKRLVHVAVVQTPTWPISPNLDTVLLNGKGTRCLEVRKYPRHILPCDLRRHLQPCSVITFDRIECMTLRDDGVLALRFESVASAADAREVFTTHPAFGGCAVRFAPDPCAQPLRVTKAFKVSSPNQILVGPNDAKKEKGWTGSKHEARLRKSESNRTLP